MPISKNTDNIAAVELPGSLSPMVKNGYRLALVFPPPSVQNTNAAVFDATGNNGAPFDTYFDMMAGGDAQISRDLSVIASKLRDPQNEMPFEVEFSPPNLSTETRTVRRGNTNIKYAGFTDIGECSMSFNNFVESRLALFLRHWYQMSAGIARAPQSAGAMLPGKNQFISRVAPALYKVNGFLYQYGHQSNSNDLQTLVVRRVYELYGVYISTLTTGAVDNSDDGGMQDLKVQFAVDYFQPDSSGSTYQTETSRFTEKNFDSIDASQLDNVNPQVPSALGTP
jgi:hypothetical protein